MNGIRSYRGIPDTYFEKIKSHPEMLYYEEFYSCFYHPLAVVEGSIDRFSMPDYGNETIQLYLSPVDCPEDEYQFPPALGNCDYFAYMTRHDDDSECVFFKTSELRKKILRKRFVSRSELTSIELEVAEDDNDKPSPQPFKPTTKE